MNSKAAENELLLESRIEDARQELIVAETEQLKARAAFEQLQARQETARRLEQVSQQLAELAQQPSLSHESPLTGELLGSDQDVNLHYSAFVERIDRQLVQFRGHFKDAQEQLETAGKTVSEIKNRIREWTEELEATRPAITTRTVTRIGRDGVPREFVVILRREVIMPWSETAADEHRYRRIRATVLLLLLLISLVIPFIPVPQITVEYEIPERMAQLIEEKKPPPPPPPKVAEKKEEPKQEQEKPKLKPRKKAPEPQTEIAKAAREKAQRSGLLAFRESFSDLMDNSLDEKLGKQARVTSDGATARRTERSIVTAGATQGSGGINTAALSRDVAGTGLSGRGTSRVTGAIGDEFGDADRPLSESVRGSRTDEEIQLVFDRNKSALYAIYQRALRNDPTLKGKIVLKITIAPSGAVLAASVESSDLNDPDLEQKIATRVKLFNFGAKDVDTVTITYPIDFLPA